MKVFISQPMKDKTDEEIKTERNYLIDCVKKEYGDNVEVIDSYFEGAPHDAKPLWFLGESIKNLLKQMLQCLLRAGKRLAAAR